MMILSVDHIQIAVPEGGEPRARKFYGDMLDFREVEKPTSLAGQGGVWFENGGLKVHLGIDLQFIPAKKAHPRFQVVDVDFLSCELQANGFAVENPAPISGMRRIFSNAPFGNRIEFCSRTRGNGKIFFEVR